MLSNIPAAKVILSNVMRVYGITDINIESIEVILTVYHCMDAIDRRSVRSAFRVLGLQGSCDALEGEDPGYVYDIKFSCPVLKCRIVSPCRVDKCRYHVENESVYNCILAAGSGEPMTDDSLAKVMNTNKADINNIIRSSIVAMRRNSVRAAQIKSDMVPEFVFFKTDKLCGVCESTIIGSPFYKEGGVSFCSAECVDKRDPWETVLESECGVPIEGIIRWARKFSSIEAASQSLGCPPSVIVSVVKRIKKGDRDEHT